MGSLRDFSVPQTIISRVVLIFSPSRAGLFRSSNYSFLQEFTQPPVVKHNAGRITHDAHGCGDHRIQCWSFFAISCPTTTLASTKVPYTVSYPNISKDYNPTSVCDTSVHYPQSSLSLSQFKSSYCDKTAGVRRRSAELQTQSHLVG